MGTLTDKHIQQLEQHTVFSHLTQAELTNLVKKSSTKLLSKNSFLFHQHTSTKHFAFLSDGKLKSILRSENGEEKVFKVIEPGDCFIELTPFTEAVAHITADVIAIETADIILVSIGECLQLMKHNHAFCLAFIYLMNNRMKAFMNDIEGLSIRSARYRLVAYLLAGLEKQDNDDNVLTLPIPKFLLASQLSIKPESLSRLIKQFVDKQFIYVSGREITILDKKGLENIKREG